MQPVTTADLCEQAHERLVGSIENPYIEDGDYTYTDEAQQCFENHLEDLEQDLCDKGYRRNLETSEWEPTRFYVGDPCLIIGEERFLKLAFDIVSLRGGTGRAYIDDNHEVPIMWAYTASGDGVFLVYETEDGEDKCIGEVTVDSSMIAFIPEDLADKDTVEKALEEEHVLPPRAINIENFSFSEENGSVTLGDVWVNVRW